MESFRLKAENRVSVLTKENETQAQRLNNMISDFENMKQELLFNNAKKDQLISQLNSDINLLKSNIQERDESLDKKNFSYSFEKQQFERELNAAKSSQADLQSKNASLISEIEKLNSQLINARFENDKQKSSSEQMTSQLSRLQSEVQQLRLQTKEKDETIERLSNNVALLKKELNK